MHGLIHGVHALRQVQRGHLKLVSSRTCSCGMSTSLRQRAVPSQLCRLHCARGLDRRSIQTHKNARTHTHTYIHTHKHTHVHRTHTYTCSPSRHSLVASSPSRRTEATTLYWSLIASRRRHWLSRPSFQSVTCICFSTNAHE